MKSMQHSRDSGPAIERPGTWLPMTNLNGRDILFIDEIHRWGKRWRKCFIGYGRLRAGYRDRQRPFRALIRLKLPHFTVVGPTTRLALLSAPLRARFGAVYRVDYYDQQASSRILERAAEMMGIQAESGRHPRNRAPFTRPPRWLAGCGGACAILPSARGR